ncbi:hypothetical protein LCGC14_1972390, partial [marine sediment metagenome]
VTTVYRKPMERVLFSPIRDANPFFHLIEALWMLAGRRDVATLEHYVHRMSEFSDNGVTFHGAYGHRWRSRWHSDQLEMAISLLKLQPQSRRAVIQIWDCEVDLYSHEKVKDIPCNLIITPWIHNQLLDLTVFCRSNDAIWGAAGANAVQFSILQEYLATKIGVGVGLLYQVSNNFHAYSEIFEELKVLRPPPVTRHYDEYTDKRVIPTKLIDDPVRFDQELEHFFKWHDARLGATKEDEQKVDMQYVHSWRNSIFSRVAIPMVKAYMVFRRCKDDPNRFEDIDRLLDDSLRRFDWLHAAQDWMDRRNPRKTEGGE